MIGGLRRIGEKFGNARAAVASAPVVVALLGSPDWKRTMDGIDEKAAEAQERRTALEAERDASDCAYIAGDQGAKAKSDRLDKQIADLNRELSRIRTARGNAAKHVELEIAAEAARRERARIDNLEGALTHARAVAGRVDHKAASLANELEDLDQACAVVRRLAESDLINTEFSLLNSKVGLVVSDYLARAMTPYKFAGLPPSLGTRTVEDLLPDMPHVLSFAAQRRNSTSRVAAVVKPVLAAAE